MSKKNQRSKFFVSPRFQLMMICISFFLVTAIFSFYYFLQNFYFIETQRFIKSISIETVESFNSEIYSLESFRDTSLLLTFIILSLLSIVYMLFLSHKIAGPIYKTIQWLKTAEAGDKILFRKEDYFQELPEELNKFSESKKKT